MNDENEGVLTCCASCGIEGIILNKSDGSDDLVGYCNDACRELHELRDELLFKQPESSHIGDCPICCLPLSLDMTKSSTNTCCSKMICDGCVYADNIRAEEMNLFPSCPFCRTPVAKSEQEMNERREIRVKANDPAAICFFGIEQREKGNYGFAFACFNMAADLGEVEAHYRLSLSYYLGEGVDKIVGKEIYHLEKAAIAGHPIARYNLGVHEYKNNNYERAAKHWIIASRQGDNKSIKELMRMYKRWNSGNIKRAIEKAVEHDATQGKDDSIKALIEKDDYFKALVEKYKTGFVSKEVLDATLRAHKAAVDATKSPQRAAAERRVNNLGLAKCFK